MPSRFQKGLWDYWERFWYEWVPKVTRGEPWDLCINGDAVEGVHHRATTPISINLQDQAECAVLVLRPIVQMCHDSGGRYFHVRGTEAHVGPSAVDEEKLARELGAVPNEDGQHARWELWKRVGDKNSEVHAPLVHLLHHISTTGSAAHEASAVNAEISAEFNEAARWGEEAPDFVVRSHRHRFISVDMNGRNGHAASMVTPGWQGRTPFTYKIAGGRLAPPQFGGILIRQGDEEFYFRREVYSLARSKEE